MARVYLGLGSNIDREQNLRAALAELRALFGRLDISPVYRCPAVGFDGADFFNLVVGFDTDMEARRVNDSIHDIEDRHGRQRNRPQFSDRTLDIDLLLYDDRIVNETRLVLPRPEIQRYAFVLKPLVDLAPTLIHPSAGRTMAELWADFPDNGDTLTEVTLDPD